MNLPQENKFSKRMVSLFLSRLILNLRLETTTGCSSRKRSSRTLTGYCCSICGPHSSDSRIPKWTTNWIRLLNTLISLSEMERSPSAYLIRRMIGVFLLTKVQKKSVCPVNLSTHLTWRSKLFLPMPSDSSLSSTFTFWIMIGPPLNRRQKSSCTKARSNPSRWLNSNKDRP